MDKISSKRFLLSLWGVLLVGYWLAFGLMYLATKDADGSAVLAIIAAVIPAGTYTGCVFFGLKLIKKERLTKKIIIAVCIFFPVTLAIITVSGIILIIPYTVKSIINLKQEK